MLSHFMEFYSISWVTVAQQKERKQQKAVWKDKKRQS